MSAKITHHYAVHAHTCHPDDVSVTGLVMWWDLSSSNWIMSFFQSLLMGELAWFLASVPRGCSDEQHVSPC
jgi:hypothetical protein